MHCGDPALTVDDECGRKPLDSTEQLRDGVRSHEDRIVDLMGRNVGFHTFPIVVHGDSKHNEAVFPKLPLEIDEPRNFDVAGAAPGRPKIQYHPPPTPRPTPRPSAPPSQPFP